MREMEKEYLESYYEGVQTQFSILGCGLYDREAMVLMHLKAEESGSRQEVETEKRGRMRKRDRKQSCQGLVVSCKYLHSANGVCHINERKWWGQLEKDYVLSPFCFSL